MPFDSRAARESAELGNEAADTRASLAAKFAAAQNELGFGAGVGNPYSAAAENKTALVNRQRGIANSAGNQLYAGSTLNKQSAARSDYDRNQKDLEDSFAQAQGAYTGGIGQTGRDEALGDAAIREGAITRAAASEPAPLAVGRGRGGRGRIGAGNTRRPQARTRQTYRGRGRI